MAQARSRRKMAMARTATERCAARNHGASPKPDLSMQTAPKAQGLYDPQFEHDACGVGFIAHVKGRKSHALIRDALTALVNLNHRGACGCEANTGDGAGI